MRKHIFVIAFLFLSIQIFSQDIRIPLDTTVVTNNAVTIKGKQISYKAQTGTQPVYDAKGNPKATLFYTYYYRTDVTNR